jgi:hypothetical protein
MRLTPVLLLVACLLPALAGAGPRGSDRVIWESSGFLSAHPDVKYRKLGLYELEQGRAGAAVKAFREAARFGDKPSQAMLGEMHWTGQGLPHDPAQAYAWMDLAAERGYTVFVAKRERYWQALDDTARRTALGVGQGLYREFGDAVARRRLEQALHVGRRKVTGSRVGARSRMTVMLPSGGQWVSVDGDRYYAPRYWQPAAYAAFTDGVWTPPPDGLVQVGEIGASPPGDAPRDHGGDSQ